MPPVSCVLSRRAPPLVSLGFFVGCKAASALFPRSFYLSNSPLEWKKQRPPRRAFQGSLGAGDNPGDNRSPSGQVKEQTASRQRQPFGDCRSHSMAQVGHEHRAPPVLPAVPAAVSPAAQRQRVRAGGACAPAVPSQHGLEDMAHLHPEQHAHPGEARVLLPTEPSKGLTPSLLSREQPAEGSSLQSYGYWLFYPVSICLCWRILVLEVYKLTVEIYQFLKTLHLKNII